MSIKCSIFKDLLVTVGGKSYGVEIRYGDPPGMTKSMHIALSDLKLSRLLVVYPGSESYPLNEKTLVVPLSRLRAELGPGKIGTA